MTPPPIVLSLSGSLRTGSTDDTVLRTARALGPAAGVDAVRCTGLAGLPHLTPDVDTDPPPAPVTRLRTAIDGADAARPAGHGRRRRPSVVRTGRRPHRRDAGGHRTRSSRQEAPQPDGPSSAVGPGRGRAYGIRHRVGQGNDVPGGEGGDRDADARR
ncbi:NAD(P)H-dependent oxidoreductase [Streptomyces sp. NPDC013313]|uniref:NADPH-dependent FMN reductase n=1 Tax=Streptomyces sp. NPDC013313 TaxID=3155603 RepID=UPI0033C6308A